VADPGRVQRRVVYYRGDVQGVGFRYTTQRIASRFSVTGYVKNLSDGRVLVEVEGEPGELERFLAGIMDRLGHHVAEVQPSVQPAHGSFCGFEIRL